MAEQEEQQQITALDTPVPGPSQTGRAVALARLLHHECTHLLQLYKEKETFLSDHTPDGGRIVSLSLDSEEPSAEEQVLLLHSALRQCLGLIHCVIEKEEEEWGELEGDYEAMRKNVHLRLEHLLHSTKDLVETEDKTLEVTPDHQHNTEETDGAGGVFGLKMWTYRVLQELIHWADHAAQTLHVLHKEREGTEEI
ncbi:ciliary neurotrophic factor [Morone saxatilis]|uniref:ciliary neurotrophic factor n=1 Tax=Morone saxatilis TaxID=34816 RepID=UPI0015E229FF|nr:ciliary neurotrophic factor [Morone saxatilis]